jgi:hypothetical protein
LIDERGVHAFESLPWVKILHKRRPMIDRKQAILAERRRASSDACALVRCALTQGRLNRPARHGFTSRTKKITPSHRLGKTCR